MSPFSPLPPRHHIRVVLSSPTLLRFMSVRNAAALAVAQLGVGAFFIPGVAQTVLGASAGWFVLAAVIFAALVRAIDLESWALLMPGGLEARVATAFGPRAAGIAAGAALVERLLLGGLACLVISHYVSGVLVTVVAGLRLTGFVRPEDLATVLAFATVGSLWIQARLGREVRRETMARYVWVGIALLATASVWGAVTLARLGPDVLRPLLSWPPPAVETGSRVADIILVCALGVALTMPIVGGGEALSQAAGQFPPPRTAALRRTGSLTVLFVLVVGALPTFVNSLLIPVAEQGVWTSVPLAGLAQHLAGPPWIRNLMSFAVVGAVVAILLPAAHAAIADAEHALHRASSEGLLPAPLAQLHTRFGTPTRAIDLTAVAVVLVIIATGGRVEWLAWAYGFAIATLVAVASATLIWFRRRLSISSPFRTPGNLRLGRREVPLGLLLACTASVVSAVVMVVSGELAAIACGVSIAVAGFWLTWTRPPQAVEAMTSENFDLLLAADLSLEQIEARPGNILVTVRNPHALAHVAAALQTAGDRDVVVMTARMIDLDVSEKHASEHTPTPQEQRIFADVVALAERIGHPVRLLIVPARNVVDAIVDTVVRLRSSDVYVGESSSLSAADQARLLGEAWERIEKPELLDVRLVIHHRSGRADTYHLGAHPPSLTSGDLDLIHRLWLDAVRSIGPHVHHHDVVRAALRQMEHELTGPERDEALAAIRSVAQPAEELAALLRARDYARLRDMLRNSDAGEVAATLTALSLEDQVIVFRVLPRKDAAAVFEYLSQEAKEGLLKTMAQEEVAELLNNMAPDERTLFLEELPAEATRQLLALLTPAERAVAVSLLGYPEKSVGRLMTPQYLAVRQHWTIREVLDYVRTHGEDSETLNVIYVVNDEGALLEDIRIREFLLAPLEKQVSELMDRRFIALKATDGQEDAVAMFRQYDRTALPVTDSAGILIGIVTIDDVLDVAEATTTRDIQRIGGSEALDEPYMDIAFARMIRKRAGWLMALFLGEMLTATAMGVFEAEISRAVVLAMFVPLIISSGGNSGSQASTLVIRALALGEVSLRDWWRVMRREFLAGIALGVILGSIGFLRISLWSAFSDMYGQHWLLVAITVAVSLVGVVLWGTLSGSLLPFALKRLGFDPAASSAPFVATLVDVTGLVIYFSVGLLVLRGTLL